MSKRELAEKIAAVLDDAGCLLSGTIQGDNEVITIEDHATRIVTPLLPDPAKQAAEIAEGLLESGVIGSMIERGDPDMLGDMPTYSFRQPGNRTRAKRVLTAAIAQVLGGGK